jgi:hypothetical protein
MGWISKIFGVVPENEREGLSKIDHPYWTVSKPNDFPAFLRVLPDIMPDGSILYLESSHTAPDVQTYLHTRQAVTTCKIAGATIWPRPEYFHIPITPENVAGLAELSEHYAVPEICDHLHVYKDGRMLLQWYDAPVDPLALSREISEKELKFLCDSLGCKYKEGDRTP